MGKVFSVIIVFLLSFFWVFRLDAFAQSSVCSAFVIPDRLQILTGKELVFTVKNTGSSALTGIKITSPSIRNMPVLNRWNENNRFTYIESSYNSAVFTKGSIEPGQEGNFHIYTQTAMEEMSALQWTIEATTKADKPFANKCSGETSVTIKGEPLESNAPLISLDQVEILSSTSAKISWITDTLALSVISYGQASTSAVTSKTDPEYVLNHEVTLTELIPETTYEYIIKAVDVSGNQDTTDLLTFVTHKEKINITPPSVQNKQMKQEVVKAQSQKVTAQIQKKRITPKKSVVQFKQLLHKPENVAVFILIFVANIIIAAIPFGWIVVLVL